MAGGVELVTFQTQFAKAFAELNYQWIEHYFTVEEEDRLALDHPVEYALNPGGEIFFILEDGEPVGTVAMVPKENSKEPAEQRFNTDKKPASFELAKMAVRPDKQGRGYSKMLMDACINFAIERQAEKIILVTNDILKPALGLYTNAGFKAVDYQDDRYARGNLEMHLQLR